MTETERRVLMTLNGLKERIECGAFRITEANISENVGDPLSVSMDGGMFAVKFDMTLEFEIIKVVKRVPLIPEAPIGS